MNQPQMSRQPDRSPQRPSDRAPERMPERLTRPNVLAGDDRFAIDLTKVPRGHRMEWKRMTLFGLQDKRNQVTLARYHWRPVPHEMQPHILGQFGKEGEHIIVDGLGLFMRPEYLCDEASEEQQHLTAYQLNQQLLSLRGQSVREVGEANTKLKRDFIAPPQTVE